MQPKDHILKELNSLKKLDIQPSKGDLSDQIFKLLMSKKFRKYSVTPEYQEHIQNAIKNSIAKNEPIKLVWVFGGYKLWRLKEAPEVDWAELFSLIYFAKWLKPICAIYKPGVIFEFFSDDSAIEMMNNIPQKDTDSYQGSFKKLLDFIRPFLPENLKFEINRIIDQYENFAEFKAEIESNMEKIKTELNGDLPTPTAEQEISLKLNVKTTPEQEKDPDWIRKAFLVHEGYSRISKRRPYYRTPEKIMVVSIPFKDTIPVGTTKTSIAKFWPGAGALKKTEDSFQDYVLSPNQIEKFKTEIEPIDIPGLEGKNFKSLRIFSS